MATNRRIYLLIIVKKTKLNFYKFSATWHGLPQNKNLAICTWYLYYNLHKYILNPIVVQNHA